MVETGRDGVSGRFAPGWKGGPGNPNNKRTHEHRKAFLELVTAEDIGRVYRRLLEAAMSGDVAAIRLWLEHAVGKPKEMVEVSGPDGAAADLGTLTGVILSALAGYPAARLAVAEALARGTDGPANVAQSGP